MRRIAVAVALVWIAAPAVAAARKAALAKKEILPAKRWNPAAREGLEAAIAALGKESKNYSEESPPVAVVALDDVAMANSPGEAVFYWMAARADFKFGPDFWNLVPEPYRRRARIGWEGFKDDPKPAWPRHPHYAMYRKAMYRAYEYLCDGWGPRLCRAWMTRLLIDMSQKDLIAYSKTVLATEEQRPVGWEAVVESPGDEEPAYARTGLRVIPEMKDLVRALLDNGFAVFLFSESNQWTAEVAAARFGIDAEHVVGPRTRLRNLIATEELLDPVPVGPGQAEALTAVIGRPPDLVVGSAKDLALLEYGGPKGVRLAIDGGDEKFRALAKERKWLLQSAFIAAPRPKR
ncbi:MAG: hypothetical protein HY078_07445 [Elusimicrobia bacterium]|nr:hypothetical protein [Elusimicrobiota bacterium]